MQLHREVSFYEWSDSGSCSVIAVDFKGGTNQPHYSTLHFVVNYRKT